MPPSDRADEHGVCRRHFVKAAANGGVGLPPDATRATTAVAAGGR